MSIKTIFLDRDGVINKEKNYLYKIEDFEFIDGVFDTCANLQSLGFKIIIITNQSGISKGYYNLVDFLNLNGWMISKFQEKSIEILDVFFCPHSPDDNCNCRKPNPGMIFEAKEKYDINLKDSWVIGDKEDDISAAVYAGITNTILLRSGHKIDELNSKAKYILNSIHESLNVINH